MESLTRDHAMFVQMEFRTFEDNYKLGKVRARDVFVNLKVGGGRITLEET